MAEGRRNTGEEGPLTPAWTPTSCTPPAGRRSVPHHTRHRWGPPWVAVVLLLTLPALADPVGAQELRGRVVDARSGQAVEQAIVEVFDQGDEKVGVGLAGRDGRFRIDLPEPGGPLHLTVWAMSYARVTVEDVYVNAYERLEIDDIRLDPTPIGLPGERVQVERSGLPPGRELVRRRQLVNDGWFFSGAVIARDNPSSLTWYLSEATDLPVTYSGRSVHRERMRDLQRARDPFILQRRPPTELRTEPMLQSPRASDNCLMVTVNHWPLGKSGYRSLDDIPVEWIAAVEIYETPNDIPREKLIGLDPTMSPDPDPDWKACGLLNVWLWNSW